LLRFSCFFSQGSNELMRASSARDDFADLVFDLVNQT
jgi:hypothetical protein